MNSSKGGKNILKSTVYLTLSRVSADICFFIFYVMLTRRFGAESIGIYSFSMAFAGTFFISADYGLSHYIAYEVSRDKERFASLIGNFMLVRLFLFLLSTGIMIAILPLFNVGAEGWRALFLISLSQFIYRFGDIFVGSFAAHEDLSKIAFMETLYKGGILVFGAAFFFGGMPFDIILTAFPLSAVVYFIFMYGKLVRHYGTPKFALDPAVIQQTVKGALPFFMTTMLGTVYFRVSPILLQSIQGYEACGYFAAPYKITEALAAFALFYRLSLFPALSRMYKESPEHHKSIFYSAFRYAALLVLPLTTALFVSAEKIILLVFGDAFRPSIPVYQVMVFYLLFAFLRQVLIATLGSVDKQWMWVKCQSIGLVTVVVLGIALIPSMSSMGAAIALLSGEAISFVLAFGLSSKRLGSLTILRALPKPVVAVVLAGALTFFGLNQLPVPVSFSLTILVCFLFFLILGEIRGAEFRFIKEALLTKRVKGALAAADPVNPGPAAGETL